MKPKKKKKAELTDLERLAPPPSPPPEQPNKTCLTLKVTFDNGEQQRYAINAVLRQEILTRLTPSLDKATPNFISFISPSNQSTVILNTSTILAIEIVRP